MSAKGVSLHRPDPRGGSAYGPVYARVDLEDVRAANTLVIHYDFDRDGWVIESPTKMAWHAGENTHDERLEEVAFVPAWSEVAGAAVDELNR